MLPVSRCSIETWKFKPNNSKGSNDKAPLFPATGLCGTRIESNKRQTQRES